MKPGDVVPDDAQGCVVDCRFTTGDIQTITFGGASEFEAWRAVVSDGPSFVGGSAISDLELVVPAERPTLAGHDPSQAG